MRHGTKRYFCGGCGAVTDGPGRYCGEACVEAARVSAVGAALETQGTFASINRQLPPEKRVSLADMIGTLADMFAEAIPSASIARWDELTALEREAWEAATAAVAK